MRFSLALAFVVLTGAAAAAEMEFLFDVLHGKTAYHASWDRLMICPWIRP